MTRVRKIIEENIPDLAERYFQIMLGKKESGMIDEQAKKRIVEGFEKILARLPLDKPDVEIETASDVIKAVCNGTISIDEAFKLMEMLSSKTNIDLANELMKPEGSQQ